MNLNLIDSHCDTISKLIKINGDIDKNDLSFSLDKIKNYSTYIQFLALWSNPENKGQAAYDYCNKMLDYVDYQTKKHGLNILKSASDLNNLKKDNMLLAIEGGEPILGKIENIEYFYKRGIRAITLTWNYANEIGKGSVSGNDEGLTEFGKSAVKKMQELGIIVDLSHLNIAGFFDVMEISKKPVIASHSNSYTIHPHKRNLTDEQFTSIIKNGGVVGLSIYPDFLSNNDASLKDVITHLEHFLSLGGENNVGIGTDFDGIKRIIPEITNSEELYKLFDELAKLNYSENLIKKISFDNFFSVIYKNFE